MNCPVCNIALLMSERQGIEIDYCPNCRGVWLDRGELDKIIERSAISENNQQKPNFPNQHFGFGNSHDHNKYHKKKSWLNELFD